MDTASLVIIPSISAIAIKLLIVWLGRYSLGQITKWAWLFFIALFGMNLIELIGFVFQAVASDAVILFFLSSYYAFAIISGLSFIALALQLSDLLGQKINNGLLLVMGVSLLVLVIPGAALLGAQSIDYSFTRIPGPLYWVVQLVIPGGWLLGLAALVYVMQRGKDWVARRRACAMLIAAAPTGLGLLLIIVLMQFGYKINATLVFSIATNFMLAVLVYTEYEHRLFRFLSAVPATDEYNLVNKVIGTLANKNAQNLASLTSQFEKALIQHALKDHGDNKTRAAKILGISRTTLNRKLLSG